MKSVRKTNYGILNVLSVLLVSVEVARCENGMVSSVRECMVNGGNWIL